MTKGLVIFYYVMRIVSLFIIFLMFITTEVNGQLCNSRIEIFILDRGDTINFGTTCCVTCPDSLQNKKEYIDKTQEYIISISTINGQNGRFCIYSSSPPIYFETGCGGDYLLTIKNNKHKEIKKMEIKLIDVCDRRFVLSVDFTPGKYLIDVCKVDQDAGFSGNITPKCWKRVKIKENKCKENGHKI